nr:MAG TPA: minor tail protein [Caudoviricetes sp.]
MSEVAAISGATGEDLQKLTDKAKEMGAKTKFSATESAEAFKYMAMAGWKTGDMLNGIEGIMNLAAASGENLGSVSDIVTDALTALGYSAKDSSHFADVLAAASSNSNTNVGMMGETFKYAAPLAGALGYSMEDLAMSIGLMANAGIKSSQAGTSLRQLFTRLAKPTKEVDKAMTKYGISLTKSGGEMKSLREVMENMRTSLQGLPADEQTAAAAAIAGQEAMTGLLAIINASDDDWDKLSKAIDNCNGSAEDMAKTMLDNLPGAVIIAKSALEGLGNAIYETYSEKAKVAVENFTLFLNELREAVEKRDIQGIINVIGDNLDSLINKIGEKGPGVIAKVSDVAGQVLDKLNEIAPDAVAAGEAILTSLAQGLQDNLPKLEEFAKQIGPKLLTFVAKYHFTMLAVGTSILTSVINGLANNTEQISTTVSDMITRIGAWFTAKAPQLIEDGKAIFKSVVKGIADATVPEDQKEAVNNNLTAVFDGIDSVIDNVVDCLGKIATWYTENQETITAVVAAFTDIASQISSIVAETVLPKMLELLGNLATWITNNKSNISTLVNNLGDALSNGLSFVNDVLTWINEHGEAVRMILVGFALAFLAIKVQINPIGTAIDAVKTAGVLLIANWETLKQTAENVWTSIKTWIDNAIASVREFLGLQPASNAETDVLSTGQLVSSKRPGANSSKSSGSSTVSSIAAGAASVSRVYGGGKANKNAGGGKSFASGIDYVPYDNYLAALHRGEAVVPKNEAERERNSTIDPAAIASAVADAVVAALSGMAVQMDGQQVGELVAPSVSAALGATVNRQKRYSGVFA